MFGFGKKRRPRSDVEPASDRDRFYVLMLAGDGSALGIMKPLLELSDAEMERTALVVDDDGQGGMVVTSDDPGRLKARYISLGFKVGIASLPQRRPAENAHMVSMDLRLTGDYRRMREDWLSS